MIKIIIADNLYKKTIGLMGKKNFNYGMYFPKVNSIHTFFMKEKIDIVGLNNDNIIMEIYPNVPKNKIIILRDSINTLELPANYSQKLKIGDYLNPNSLI